LESTSSAGIQGNTQQLQEGRSIYSGVSANQLQNGVESSSYGSGPTSSVLYMQISGRLNVENVTQGQSVGSTALPQQSPATTSGRTDVAMFAVLGIVLLLSALVLMKVLHLRSGHIRVVSTEDLDLAEEPKEPPKTIQEASHYKAVEPKKSMKEKTTSKKKHKKKSEKRK
jgi:hypothetical protein